jgi:hypothetical protein
MASELLSSLSPDDVALRLRQPRVEPDFDPPSAPRPMTERGKLTQIPEASSPSRCSDVTRLPAGMLLYLVSVALVAAAITGSLFAAGFSLLPSTASKVITNFDRNPRVGDGNTPEADREAVLVSRETGMVAVDILSGVSLGQRPTADEVAAPQQSKEVQGFPPAPSNGEPPAETASGSEPASSSATPPDSPMPLANRPSFAAKDVIPPAGAKTRPAHDGHSAHTRTAPQYSRPHSVPNVPTLTPPQSPFAQTRMPPQPSSFGKTKPVGQALTLPKAEQPDK